MTSSAPGLFFRHPHRVLLEFEAFKAFLAKTSLSITSTMRSSLRKKGNARNWLTNPWMVPMKCGCSSSRAPCTLVASRRLTSSCATFV
ncbi:hypothetical protein D3C87_2008900 [compost metagenome]